MERERGGPRRVELKGGWTMGTLGLRDGSKYQLVIATICASFRTTVDICLIFYFFLFNFLGHSKES